MENKDVLKMIDFTINATDTNDDYSMGLRNGLRLARSYLTGEEPEYENTNAQTSPEEISCNVWPIQPNLFINSKDPKSDMTEEQKIDYDIFMYEQAGNMAAANELRLSKQERFNQRRI